MEAQYAFRISKELLDQLRKIAKAEDMTIAQLFRKLARERVEKDARTVRKRKELKAEL